MGKTKHHKGPTDRVSAAKIFPLSAFSRADIYLTCLKWTLDACYQTTLGSPVPGRIFSMRCWTAWDCDVTSTVDVCHKNSLWTTFCINRFHWLQAAVAWGLSTDELIMLSRVQLLIFAVAYAVWALMMVNNHKTVMMMMSIPFLALQSCQCFQSLA
jgi:hypothetical protein